MPKKRDFIVTSKDKDATEARGVYMQGIQGGVYYRGHRRLVIIIPSPPAGEECMVRSMGRDAIEDLPS
jgi:hypothetical protein